MILGLTAMKCFSVSRFHGFSVSGLQCFRILRFMVSAFQVADFQDLSVNL